MVRPRPSLQDAESAVRGQRAHRGGQEVGHGEPGPGAAGRDPVERSDPVGRFGAEAEKEKAEAAWSAFLTESAGRRNRIARTSGNKLAKVLLQIEHSP